MTIRNTDKDFAATDALQFRTRQREKRWRDMFEDFCAKNEIDRSVGEAQFCGVSLDTRHAWVHDAGCAQVEGEHGGKAFGK